MNNEMVKVDPEEMNERTNERHSAAAGKKSWIVWRIGDGRTEREVRRKEPYRPLAVATGAKEARLPLLPRRSFS